MNQTIKTVYLAGPISGLSYRECVRWREYAVRQFAFPREGPVKIVGMSPLRFKSFLSGENVVQHEYPNVLCNQRGITARDFHDVRTTDALLVNFIGSTIVSIGTVMEITLAHELRKPVVVAMDNEGDLHDHPMVRECIDFRVPSLDEAIHVTKAILLPGYHVDGDVVFNPMK